jgi:hypothetical protein
MAFTSKTEALPRKKRALRGRRLVVAEIEGIAEGAVRTVSLASWAKRQVAEAIALKEGEQVIVGATHRSVLPARMVWPQSRIVTGPRAEDVQNEILQVLQEERIPERFDELVLASGNGVYAEAVASLGASGVEVTVVAWPENLSKRLRMAAAHVVLLERGTEILGGVG